MQLLKNSVIAREQRFNYFLDDQVCREINAWALQESQTQPSAWATIS